MTGQADERDLLAAAPAVHAELARYVVARHVGLDVAYLDPDELRRVGRRVALLGADMVRLANRLERTLPIPFSRTTSEAPHDDR